MCVSVFTCLQILIRFTDLVAFKCACSFDIQLINLNVLTYYLTQATVFIALTNAFTLQLLHILYVIFLHCMQSYISNHKVWTCYSLSTHSAFIAKIVEEIYWNRHESWRLFSVFLEWVLSECTQVEFVFIVVHTRTHTLRVHCWLPFTCLLVVCGHWSGYFAWPAALLGIRVSSRCPVCGPACVCVYVCVRLCVIRNVLQVFAIKRVKPLDDESHWNEPSRNESKWVEAGESRRGDSSWVETHISYCLALISL